MKKYLIAMAMTTLLIAGCTHLENILVIGAASNGVLTAKEVQLRIGGFLVIYQSINGSPGSMVGKSEHLDGGVTMDLNVPFTSTPGQTYIAVLRDDTDNNGILNESKDMPSLDKNGQKVMESFTVPETKPLVTSTPSPTTPSSPSSPTASASDSIVLGSNQAGKLTVTSVNLSKPGFIGIFNSIGDAPGQLVGKSDLLKAGASSDLTVSFKSTPGKPYFAMLRADNGDGKFDENTDDPINGADGQTVMKTFTAAP